MKIVDYVYVDVCVFVCGILIITFYTNFFFVLAGLTSSISIFDEVFFMIFSFMITKNIFLIFIT